MRSLAQGKFNPLLRADSAFGEDPVDDGGLIGQRSSSFRTGARISFPVAGIASLQGVYAPLGLEFRRIALQLTSEIMEFK
jgi:hypothetical protein